MPLRHFVRPALPAAAAFDASRLKPILSKLAGVKELRRRRMCFAARGAAPKTIFGEEFSRWRSTWRARLASTLSAMAVTPIPAAASMKAGQRKIPRATRAAFRLHFRIASSGPVPSRPGRESGGHIAATAGPEKLSNFVGRVSTPVTAGGRGGAILCDPENQPGVASGCVFGYGSTPHAWRRGRCCGSVGA